MDAFLTSGRSMADQSTPRTNDELADLVFRWFGVRFPDTAVCPGHVSPWSVFCGAYFARDPVIVAKASRLFGGKSFLLATLGLTEALTLGVDVDVLGGSGTQSKRVVRYMRDHIHSSTAPTGIMPQDMLSGETTLPNGAIVRPMMASQTSIRGSHATRLRLDEADEIKPDLYDASTGITYAKGRIKAQKLVASTHHHADGTMTKVLREAAEKGHACFEWCYKETHEDNGGWLAQSEIDRKRDEMTASVWAAEVELQEPEPEGRAIVTEKVDAMFDRSLGEAEGRDGEALEFEPPARGAKYITGVDWAKHRDFTTIVTFRDDVTPIRLVAFLRVHRKPWTELIAAANDRGRRYGPGPGHRAAHDATGMNVAGDYLSTLFQDLSLTGKPRHIMLSTYVRAIEHDTFRCPMVRSMYSEHKYCRNDDLWTTARTGHLPDTVSAAGTAFWARARLESFGAERFMSLEDW